MTTTTEQPLLDPNHWREACKKQLEKRLGWLRHEVGLANGNLTKLPEHHQKLWRWRESAVGEFNRIGTLVKPESRVRLYKKLYAELVD